MDQAKSNPFHEGPDGYHELMAKESLYRDGMEKMIAEGIMPGKMSKPGNIFNFARWVYTFGMIPFVLSMLYAYAQFSGHADLVVLHWNRFAHENPSVGKASALLLTLGAIGLLAFLMFGPLIKLGILPFGEKPDLDAEALDTRNRFYQQPMRTRSAFNVLYINVLSIVLFLAGMLVSLVAPIVGTGMVAFVFIVVAAWWFWQQKTRPVFGFSQTGNIYVRYPHKEWRLNLANCKSITMFYADNMYYVDWYKRPFTREAVNAVGSSTLFPFRLLFKTYEGPIYDLVILNASFPDKEPISAHEIEIFVAELIHQLGFGIQLQYDGYHISGWVAKSKN